jgi:hypothetical protein
MSRANVDHRARIAGRRVRSRRRAVTVLVALAALAGGCDDPLDQRLGLIDDARVLAVIAEPAEAKPGATITYEAVIASPGGPLALAPSWGYCTSPKPPTEDNAASTDCVGGNALIDLGTAPTVMGALPAEGCIRFGPDVPPGGFRPRDPDASGGYFQPVRVASDDLLAIGQSRITCNLPTAPFEAAARFRAEYVANANPVLDPIVLDRVAANADVTLSASWPETSAESYLYFDADAQQLVDRREAMRVSWFATGGTLAEDATAVAEDARATSASTTWRTPAAGDAWIWIVLRDSRGGVAVRAMPVTVQ